MPAFTTEELAAAFTISPMDPNAEPVRQRMLAAATETNEHLSPGYEASMWLTHMTNATAWACQPGLPATATALPVQQTTGCCRDRESV